MRVLEPVEILEDDDVLRLAAEVVDDLIEVLVEERVWLVGRGSNPAPPAETSERNRPKVTIRTTLTASVASTAAPTHAATRTDVLSPAPVHLMSGSQPSRYSSVPTQPTTTTDSAAARRLLSTAILLNRDFFPTFFDAPYSSCLTISFWIRLVVVSPSSPERGSRSRAAAWSCGGWPELVEDAGLTGAVAARQRDVEIAGVADRFLEPAQVGFVLGSS